MVEPGSNGTPEDRAREALQRVENLIRVAASRVIGLREVWERRHLRAADRNGLDAQLLELRAAIDEILEQLLEAWGDFSIADEELASHDEEASS